MGHIADAAIYGDASLCAVEEGVHLGMDGCNAVAVSHGVADFVTVGVARY